MRMLIIQVASAVYLFTKFRELYYWARLSIHYNDRRRMKCIGDACDGPYKSVRIRSLDYRFRGKLYTIASHEALEGPPMKWNCATEKFEEI